MWIRTANVRVSDNPIERPLTILLKFVGYETNWAAAQEDKDE